MTRTMLIFLAALAVTGPHAAAAETLRLEGEVYARSSAMLMPPTIDDLWQLNIASLVPDGQVVAQGDVVVQFDAGQVQQQLMQKQSALAEKQSQLAKLQIDLAERERNERLATADAKAKRDKAARKAEQPEDLLRRVDYRKLVAEREHAERAHGLAVRRERLAADARRHEQRVLDAELRQLQADVQRLMQAIAELQVRSPRDGIVQHLSDWQGNKFDVGSQVWRGLSVAQVPDMATLAVQASLPEHQQARLREGLPVKVAIEGNGVTVGGTISEMGRVIRSKSRLQPVPVLDVWIELERIPRGLKPGQAVRVEVEA